MNKKPITIKELIEKLKEYPEDLAVLVDGYEGGLEYISFNKTEAYYNPTAYCGSFAETWFKSEEQDGKFEALVLTRDDMNE